AIGRTDETHQGIAKRTSIWFRVDNDVQRRLGRNAPAFEQRGLPITRAILKSKMRVAGAHVVSQRQNDNFFGRLNLVESRQNAACGADFVNQACAREHRTFYPGSEVDDVVVSAGG